MQKEIIKCMSALSYSELKGNSRFLNSRVLDNKSETGREGESLQSNGKQWEAEVARLSVKSNGKQWEAMELKGIEIIFKKGITVNCKRKI